MAEKEERYISITQMVAKENIETEKYQVMPRQDAINRMAKAMCHSPFESCEGCIVQKKKQACKQAIEGMRDLAEVALNALLEGK